MIQSKEIIIQEIKRYIDMTGGDYPNWYVGIATNPEQRLYEEHNVDKNGLCVYREAENSNIAREIEEYFVNILGTDGGGGGGDNTTRFVYAYKKTAYTNQ